MLVLNDLNSCNSLIRISDKVDFNKELSLNLDSRTLKSNDTFLAISGENINAVRFLKQAEDASVETIIYTKNSKNDELVEPYRDKFVFIEVEDSIKTLQELTRILSDRFQRNGGKLIAISGSNGKTTTKEMLYHLLSGVEPETICTQKNNNNHIGVPLTLLQITKRTKYAIVELGSNHPGEIKILCEISNPSIGITTNIGDTHLEFFQNRENVFKEEGYLYHHIDNLESKSKYFFTNKEDEYLTSFSGTFCKEFGFSTKDLNFSIEKERVIVKNEDYEYSFTNKYITGQHNFYNLCVAFVIAKTIDQSNSKRFVSLCESFKPTSNRSEWIKYKTKFGDVKIFLDAYNANPSSMRAAISGFLDEAKDSYQLIIGDMNELGDSAQKYHKDLGEELQRQKVKEIIFVGQYGKSFKSGCNYALTFEDVESLKSHFETNVLKSAKYVFIKGSRSLQLESILDITSP